MEMLTPHQIDRIYAITDGLALHRNAVIVPLKARESGFERIMPDGRLLIIGPGNVDFEDWFDGLNERVTRMDLGRARHMV